MDQSGSCGRRANVNESLNATLQGRRRKETGLLQLAESCDWIGQCSGESSSFFEQRVELSADGGAEQGQAEAELATDGTATRAAEAAAEAGADALTEQQRERATDQRIASDVLPTLCCSSL